MGYARELLAVALAEMRSARRLTRTWLFSALSLIIGLGLYIQFTAMHGLGSALSPSVGVFNPRFMMASQGVLLVVVFVVAVIFLAFDIRARDTRERIAEVLDVRPVDNLTLLVGRLAGLVFIAWLVVALLALSWQGLGALAQALDWPAGDLVEPRSLLALLFLDAPPALVMWCSVVILLAVTVRNRIAVAVLALGLVAGWIWGSTQLPLYLQPAIAGQAAVAIFPSDIVPFSVPAFQLAQRACMLVLGAGFLFLAAALHPRADHRRPQRLTIGAALVVLAGAGILVLLWKLSDDRAQQAHWLAVHQARQDDPRPGLESVAGTVVIAPGDQLALALDYVVAPPGGQPLLFSLNPGMRLTALRVEGDAADFSHRDGLLEIDLPPALADRSTLTISLAASGVPQPAFGYLDSAKDLATLRGSDATLAFLGSQASVFDERYVALMPGVFWMPLPGAAAGRDDPARHGRDYFGIDIAVEVPSDWLVAGPGRREGADGRFRFRPAAPVPELALLAGKFERSAMQAAGVELELLTSAEHPRNKAFFADAVGALEEHVTELFSSAEKMGIGYPYGGLSVVEVPMTLRSYGGGWRMDSVQAAPGLVMLRETGWPTARFDNPLLDLDEEDAEDREGGVGAAKLEVLERFFQNDVTGGNPLHGAVRNLIGFQTGAQGDGAIALDFVLHDLAVQLLTESRSGFFSPFAFASNQALNSLIADAVTSMITGGGSIGGTVYLGSTRAPSVWDRALGASLADLDPTQDAELALKVLWLKGPEIAQAMLDGLGRERTAAMLAELRRRHTGGNFTTQEFSAAAAAVGVDLETLLGDWLHDSALPGFLASGLRIERLADDDQGQPRYQISIHVRNDEPVPGLVRLSYGEWHGEKIGWIEDATPPVRVAGNTSLELGLVASRLPEQLKLALYLSLNREHALLLPVPEIDQEQTTAAAPFTGWRPSTWLPEVDSSIVVDDLDPGFSVAYDDSQAGLRLSATPADWAAPQTDIDQGLPVHSQFGSGGGWTRQPVPASWGKYRRTVARTDPGEGDAKAVFTAQLPTGRWRLAYHLPELRLTTAEVRVGRVAGVVTDVQRRTGWAYGSYDMRITVAGEETSVEFDGAAAEPGWNRIGDYDLPGGEVRLAVSNETSGDYVIADAVRWQPVPAQ